MGQSRNLCLRLSEIENIDTFSEGLVSSMEQHVDEADRIPARSKWRLRIPPEIGYVPRGSNHILYERIADYIENRDDYILWLESRSESSFSLRLANSEPSLGHIAVLTIQPDLLLATQNR